MPSILRLFFVTCLLFLATPAKSQDSNSESLPFYPNWGGDFTLTDHHGLEISLHDFAGKVVLLAFGYTHCPDICPNTMFIMRNIMRQLDGERENVQVLFITLDPERDYPERLKTFVEFFDPTFVALTGTVDEIQHVAEPYGMKFEKEFYGDESALDYGIAHSNVIYLLDQQQHIRAFFKINAPADIIATDVKKLLAEKQNK